MSNFSNELTDAQAERLAILLEEMGEALQATGKILRHGYDSNNPNLPRPADCGTPTGNRQDLEKELGHVMYAIDAMAAAKDINGRQVEHHLRGKAENIKPYLHHQEVTA